MATGVYWIGADRNVYVKAAGGPGVVNVGPIGVANPKNFAGLTEIADPNPPSVNTGGASGGGGGSTYSAPSAPAVDPAQIALYDQGIGNLQAGINRLGSQQASGNSAIDASYQNALNTLLLGKNQSETAYKGNKQTTATDFVGAKNTIGSQAGSLLSGLQRLLGSRGAGGGTAYNVAAPQAVARGATIQRNEAGNAFAANNQALDTSWGNFMTGYNNEVNSAGAQRDQGKQSLEQSIESNRASLLQQLAKLSADRASAAGGNPVGAAQPYIDQANAVLDRSSNYVTAPINFTTQAYQAPSLASYDTKPVGAPTYQGTAPSNDFFSPYLASLLGKKQLAGV